MSKQISQGRLRKPDLFTSSFAAAGSLLLIFVLLPLLSTLLGTTPAALWDTLRDADVIASLGLSFYTAAWATLLAMLSGVPLAYILARYDFPGKYWVEGIVNLPIIIPHTAAGIALLMVFGRQALLGQALGAAGLRFTDEVGGIVVGMLFVSLPFLVNTAREAFVLVDPELEQMAQTMGASRWQAFRYVALPLAWRGIAAGAVMTWGRSVSEFGAVVILAYHPKIIPVLVYERFAGYGLAAATPVAVILILAALAIFVLLQALLAAWQRTIDE
ncbi:MAG: ABC transporter permease [Thermoflexales bacterium]|nr:ABC transporter permease [Thermoflexales bacterium]